MPLRTGASIPLGNDPEPAGAPGAALGVYLYARLVRDPAHVEGVLTMMARWDLAALEADLPAIVAQLLREFAQRVGVPAAH